LIQSRRESNRSLRRASRETVPRPWWPVPVRMSGERLLETHSMSNVGSCSNSHYNGSRRPKAIVFSIYEEDLQVAHIPYYPTPTILIA
jgi:hypothetical protein